MSLAETSSLFIEGKSSNTKSTYSSLSKNFSEYLESMNLSLDRAMPFLRDFPFPCNSQSQLSFPDRSIVLSILVAVVVGSLLAVSGGKGDD